MTQPKSEPEDKGRKPDWTNGLRQLYDSVVDEPIPDTFMDLLSQLDDSGSKPNGHAAPAKEGKGEV